MKKLLSFSLLLVLVITCAIGLSACKPKEKWDEVKKDQVLALDGKYYTPTSTDYFTFEVSGDSYYISGLKKVLDVEDLVIPPTYEGFPIAGINNNVFNEVKIKRLVILGDTIIYSGNFSNCKNLEYIVFPNIANYFLNYLLRDRPVDASGGYAFENCPNIKDVWCKNDTATIFFRQNNENVVFHYYDNETAIKDVEKVVINGVTYSFDANLYFNYGSFSGYFNAIYGLRKEYLGETLILPLKAYPQADSIDYIKRLNGLENVKTVIVPDNRMYFDNCFNNCPNLEKIIVISDDLYFGYDGNCFEYSYNFDIERDVEFVNPKDVEFIYQ